MSDTRSGHGRRFPSPLPPRQPVAEAIGILGGTFDPIHFGHLAVAEEAREVLGLERVIFVPAGVPPHKPDAPISVPAHRLAMVELAIADNPAFELSRIEVDRQGPSYTVETVERLVVLASEAGRTVDLTVILSAESFRGLRTWRDPDRLLSLARLAVVPRGGYAAPGRSFVEEHFPGFVDRVTFLDAPHTALSATEIRARVAAGRSIRYLLPPAVAAYIDDHELYTSELWRKN